MSSTYQQERVQPGAHYPEGNMPADTLAEKLAGLKASNKQLRRRSKQLLARMKATGFLDVGPGTHKDLSAVFTEVLESQCSPADAQDLEPMKHLWLDQMKHLENKRVGHANAHVFQYLSCDMLQACRG